jgi:hypothetical protein
MRRQPVGVFRQNHTNRPDKEEKFKRMGLSESTIVCVHKGRSRLLSNICLLLHIHWNYLSDLFWLSLLPSGVKRKHYNDLLLR